MVRGYLLESNKVRLPLSDTAAADWCEQNYALLPWVCETFNTSPAWRWSSPALGLSRQTFAREVRVAFALLVLVGLGSIAFHATLRFELQMLDELPMLYLLEAVQAAWDPGAADVHRLLRLRSSCCGLQARRTEPPERWVREAVVAAAPFFRYRRNGCSTSTSPPSSLGAANFSFS